MAPLAPLRFTQQRVEVHRSNSLKIADQGDFWIVLIPACAFFGHNREHRIIALRKGNDPRISHISVATFRGDAWILFHKARQVIENCFIDIYK